MDSLSSYRQLNKTFISDLILDIDTWNIWFEGETPFKSYERFKVRQITQKKEGKCTRIRDEVKFR